MEEQLSIEETQEIPQKLEVVAKIKGQYGSEQIHQFVALMNDVLRIVSNANIEITDTISNLIFCVFATFFPEVFECMNQEEKKDSVAGVEGEEAADKSKYDVTMIPIEESLSKKHAEKFVLFKKFVTVTPRI